MAVLAEQPILPTRAVASYAVELMWAFEGAGDDERIESTPLYKGIFADDSLRARAREIFDDPSRCHEELIVLANAGGVLESSAPETTLAGIARALGQPHARMRLSTETVEDRAVIHERLASLIEDVGLRERYLSLLAEVSLELERAWNAGGREIAHAEAERLRVELDRGPTWHNILERNCPQCGAIIDRLGSDFTPERMLVIPSAYARPRSALILDLPGCFVAGVSARRDVLNQKAHAELARRLKAVADPTRLSLLVRLAGEDDATVGSLARSLGVSQPTVSNHLKILREAGLVSGGDRSGTGRSLVVDSSQLDELISELRSSILSAAPARSVGATSTVG
jgi:ArsR family transcriptional regulator, arsenate/arsenite/antimonite-responsive transcriptional repressor